MLKIALKCQNSSKLGYIGVDIAIDSEKGPVVFEINARPGLGIQVANQTGLRWRLEKVKDLKIKSIAHGIRVAKNLFGGEIEESIEAISGRKVLNITERISVYHKGTDISKIKRLRTVKKEIVKAFMDTGILTSRISSTLANRIGFLTTNKEIQKFNIPNRFGSFKEAQEYLDKFEKEILQIPDVKRLAKILEDGEIKIRPVFEVPIKLSDTVKVTEFVSTDAQDSTYSVVIGRSELSGYLIDTSDTF
jgi:hypothetical protein